MHYTLQVEVIRGTSVNHTDDADRVWFLVQEWIKQPRTKAITVSNSNGRRVFNWTPTLHRRNP